MAKQLRPSRVPPDIDTLVAELGIARETAFAQRKALEAVKRFLLDLHQRSVYLPSELQSQLDQLLAPLLNGTFARPTGRAAQRSREEKKAIVEEYFIGIALKNGSGAAVCRKYGTHPRYIYKWRKEIEAGAQPKDQKWLTKNDPWMAALAKIGTP